MRMQVKAKAARKISYDEFLTALPLVADKKASAVGFHKDVPLFSKE